MAIDPPAVASKVPAVIYYRPEGCPDVIYAGTVKERLRQWDEKTVQAEDLRTAPITPTLSIDRNGFELRQHETSFSDWVNTAAVKTDYYKECEELVKAFTGATRAICFSHVRRLHSHAEAIADAKLQKPEEFNRKVAPACYAHVDESFTGAEECLRDNIPKEYLENMETLKKTRWAIINLWRPIDPVTRDPLAICDAATVEPEDLHHTTMVLPVPAKIEGQDPPKGKQAGMYLLGKNEKHQWYFTTHMQPNELYLLKIFDTKLDGRARCAPHCAIQTPFDEGPARHSIDTRMFVFWEDQDKE